MRMIKKMAWLPVIALLLLLMLSTPALAAAAVLTYSDVGRTILLDDFTIAGNLVYTKATKLSAGNTYNFEYRDAASRLLETDGPITADGNKEALSEMMPSDYQEPRAAYGTWTCTVIRISTGATVATHTFTVQDTAIPEFPTALSGALVAGICFGIYYWMRRRIGYAPA